MSLHASFPPHALDTWATIAPKIMAQHRFVFSSQIARPHHTTAMEKHFPCRFFLKPCRLAPSAPENTRCNTHQGQPLPIWTSKSHAAVGVPFGFFFDDHTPPSLHDIVFEQNLKQFTLRQYFFRNDGFERGSHAVSGVSCAGDGGDAVVPLRVHTYLVLSGTWDSLSLRVRRH